MNKYVIMFIIIIAIVNRIFVFYKTLKLNIKNGIVYKQWITKLIFIFYPLVFILSILEIFIIKRAINYYISSIAFIIYIIGVIVWIWAMQSLGQYWSTEIEIRKVQPLIKKGPYKYMRHPHYLFIFCELFGIPLIANAYYSLLLIIIIYVPLISLRIIFEEKELIKKFGNKYKQYQKEVWALFPFPIFKRGIRDDQ